MPKLRADEHRYLVTATGVEEALVRRIPGCRFLASLQALQLPRQPGTIIALDHVFGADQWEHVAELAQEVSETRSRQVAPAQQPATVTLVGNELSVECAFGDKELVKLVPGYRWSAPQRRWFLPASPMALDLLREHFGAQLVVDPATLENLALKREDEETAVERARGVAQRGRVVVVDVATVARADELAGDVAEGAQLLIPALPSSVASAELSTEVVGRLTDAILSLEGVIAQLVERLSAGGISAPPAIPAAELEERYEATSPPADGQAWRELLVLVDSNPAEALGRINPQLQLAGEEQLPALRALAGISASLAGDHESALTYLRKAEEHSAVQLEPELQRRSRNAYRDSVFALITAGCGPQRPVASIEAVEELVLAELVHDTGFDDGKLAARPALEILSFLMDDAYLRSFDAVLSDHCRVLHLLSLARGGNWMAAERVIEMLRHRDLTDDGFGLGLMVLANTVFEQPCMDEWLLRWPPEASEIGFDELRWIVAGGVARLRTLDTTTGSEAALAMLALMSAAPSEVANMDVRRELVRLVPPKAPARRYAEFLAAYQLAAAGHKHVAQHFPGYLQVLANAPLFQSAGHLLTVFVNDSGGAASTIRRIAEDVFLESVRVRGVRDPETEVLELLDMLAESPKGDNLMNQLSLAVEEDAFPGGATFGHAHRRRLYDRAFRQTLKAGHDVDSVAAFDRLVRELVKHGETEELRTLCLGIPPGFKPLQMPVGQALLSLQLEAGEDFEATAEAFLRHCNPKDPGDEGTHEVKGLALAFPKFREFLLKSQLPESEIDDERLRGKRLVVVGGHEWLRKHAMPQFEAWGVKATWLDPDSAKNGAHALDLAAGSADVVIVNTACISHAASGRVIAAADKATNVKKAYHKSRGVGALLSIARESLADTQPPIASKTAPTKHDRRKKMLR